MLSLLLNYLKHRKQNDESPKFNLLDPKEIPYVTIQLPLYNEKYVVPRLLENIAKLEYPRTKLEIQVLDPSTAYPIFFTHYLNPANIQNSSSFPPNIKSDLFVTNRIRI